MDEVIFSKEGQMGVITLNRPSALNALTLAMIQAMYEQLMAWRDDAEVGAVLIRAVPGTAFCAGGDVRWLYQKGKEQAPEQLQFFWHEYRLNYLIHHLGKPYIALMDGLTMGGGVGVSLHGTFPIASERFVFAMPETSIGFFPDIGASKLLNRCPGSLGVYLGLTGNRLNADEAVLAGLAYAKVLSESLDDLYQDMVAIHFTDNAIEQIQACVQKYSVAVESRDKSEIDHCFSKPTVESILEHLASGNEDWHQTTYKLLGQKCPLSLKVTLEQLHKTKGLSLADCLSMDFELVQHFMKGTEFYEGVRALLVDKDKQPRWNPASLNLVSDELVASYFEQIGEVLRVN